MTELEEYLVHCEMKHLAPRTTQWYKEMLGKFFHYLAAEHGVTEVEDIRSAHIRAYMKTLMDRNLTPNTINGYLRSIKTCLNYFLNEEIIESNPAKKVPMTKVPKKTIKTFEIDQLQALFQAWDRRTFSGMRNQTMCRFLLDTGVRITELLTLTVADVNPKERLALIRHGKGDKERYVPFGRQMAVGLMAYLRKRKTFFKQYPGDKGILFPSGTTRGVMSRHTFYRICKQAAEERGIEGVRASAHTFRHTFAKLSIMKGCDLLTLQQIMGHEDTSTTKRYVHLFKEELRAQHDRFSPLDGLTE